MKIVLAASGRGGHLFPALYVAEALRKEKNEVMFVGSFGQGQEYIRKYGFISQEISTQGFSLKHPFRFLKSFFLMIQASFSSIRILRQFKPNAVAGFGGYGSFPVVIAASLLRIPTLIHEQNVIPGKANRVLAGIAQKIAISFKQSKKYFTGNKVVLTGCPCHEPVQEIKKEEIYNAFRLENNKITILVIGGSQGSRRINQEALEMAKILKGQLEFQMIHVTGASDYAMLKEQYALLNVPYALFEFLPNIEEAYSICNLIIARAGAVTVAEIIKFRLPAILIPYPYAAGHQRQNASVLEEQGVATVIEEKDLASIQLKNAVIKCLEKFRLDKDWLKHFAGIVPDNPATHLSQEIMALAR